VRWDRLKSDFVAVVKAPVIGLGYLAGSILFTFFGWLPGVLGYPLMRYCESEKFSGVGKSMVAVSYLWLVLLLFGRSEVES